MIIDNYINIFKEGFFEITIELKVQSKNYLFRQSDYLFTYWDDAEYWLLKGRTTQVQFFLVYVNILQHHISNWISWHKYQGNICKNISQIIQEEWRQQKIELYKFDTWSVWKWQYSIHNETNYENVTPS